MEPGITGLVDVTGDEERERERPRFSEQTNVIARESALALRRARAHARSLAYTVIVLPRRPPLR